MLTLLDPDNPHQPFPPPAEALSEPNGLLAVGGDLSPTRLLEAYRQGIFPWYNPGEPILWWSPDPRLVLFPERLKVSRSLRKLLRKGEFEISFDRDFEAVIDGCAAPRPYESGTWITPEMRAAYLTLHRQGHAHSVECWYEGELAGGLYGVAIGQVFYGESMFYRKSNASKVAFVTLVEHLRRWNYRLIDCQVHTHHLQRFGAEEIPRDHFTALLQRYCAAPCAPEAWRT
ncbi:leucyl/phenylalanyl-tRNA---protein transferase [Methylomarinovum tepidoasis]|uniref:Leucyl/phenylalanyl-tRNA--protein transferase n=1 Tax=Methylomarinovum tepidoasis TaxID=2840183 RepID=A0AAU9C857_9GAMM|nr:leucyl/phenylalanyl-tRNA--protein transferase [Methylomarinovum sp. IN45]BCX89464.1 leucyl/phenylalanyl-tRNA---protein transferase [Methylomarinovum sp. IN45]